MSLDCDTPKGQSFIKSQHYVEKLVEQKFNVVVKSSDKKVEKYDATIFKGEKLCGVCEIKTRVYWNRDKKTPFTLNSLKDNGYLITAEKLEVLRNQSLTHSIVSCIFLNIPFERKLVCIPVTNKSGEFMLDFRQKTTKTKYSCNDSKGSVNRVNAYIDYNPKIFRIFDY